jgi:ankyrin repeat protein
MAADDTKLCRMRNLVLFALAASLAAGQVPPEIRRTVERALPPIQQSAAAFVAKRACVSCHHNILTVLMLHEARNRGFRFDSAVLNSVETKTFRALTGPAALDDAIQAVTVNDPTPNDSYLLMAASAAGIAPNAITSVYARRLVAWQRDGHWITSDFRPPHSSSFFTATATAVRAITLYASGEHTAGDACIARARDWLVRTKPHSTEDAAFRLMGLVWASASADEVNAARRDLAAMRSSSGGWPELPGYAADAYSTGEAIYALALSGAPASDSAVRTGLRFLISTQAVDGTWRVHTRMLSPAEVSPEYFATGFPYGKDEFLSYAGSVWAVMGLLTALPSTAPSQPSPPSTSVSVASGLAPGARGERGTTPLMIAAADAEQVRRLLAEGADPRARAASGVDALTIAAASRGTAASLRLLLDAGADPNLPEGVHSKNTPLLLASMTGDVDNVKLLLARGARPSSAALAEAVTFGYPDIARILIDAGANAKQTENSGINLLHWAVIANRTELIPILIHAGTPLNAQDEHGFTPLMYAATIDFGDTASLEALLKAGADPTLRNEDGRTAIEQAHHFGHVNLETVLRNSKR